MIVVIDQRDLVVVVGRLQPCHTARRVNSGHCWAADVALSMSRRSGSRRVANEMADVEFQGEWACGDSGNSHCHRLRAKQYEGLGSRVQEGKLRRADVPVMIQ